jgi:hypothetical protein
MVRSAATVILPVVTVLFWSRPAPATNQRGDIIRFEGVDRPLVEYPLNSLFWQMSEPPEFEMITTANYKGYLAEWEIKGGAQFLRSFEGRLKGEMVGPEVILPGRKLPVLADWYTGRLRIAAGDVVRDPPGSGFHDLVFARVVVLHVEKGRVVRSEEFKNFRIRSDREEEAIERARHCLWTFPRRERDTLRVGSRPDPRTLCFSFATPEALRRSPVWAADAAERWTVPHFKESRATPAPDEFVAVGPHQTVRYRARLSDPVDRTLESFGLVEPRRPERPDGLEYFLAAWPPANTELADTGDAETQVFAFGYGRVPVIWCDKPGPPERPVWTRLADDGVGK